MAAQTLLTQDFWDKPISKARQEREERDMERGFCDANIPPIYSGWIVGKRNGAPTVCKWEVSCRDGRLLFSIVEGGVTGYESWYIESMIFCGLFDDDSQAFCANAGGMGWDELTLDLEGVRAIVRLASP